MNHNMLPKLYIPVVSLPKSVLLCRGIPVNSFKWKNMSQAGDKTHHLIHARG